MTRVHTSIVQQAGDAPFIRLTVGDGQVAALMPTEAKELAERLIELAEDSEELWRAWDEAHRAEYIETLKAKASHG